MFDPCRGSTSGEQDCPILANNTTDLVEGWMLGP